MSIKETFGKKMQLLRKSKGISLKELSEKANVTPTALSNYEKGSREPTITTAFAIAEALGTTINDLCGFKNEKSDCPMTYGDIYLLVCELAKRTCSDLSIEKDFVDVGYDVLDNSTVSFAFHNVGLINAVERFADVYKLQRSGTIDDELLDAWVDKELSQSIMKEIYQIRAAEEPF